MSATHYGCGCLVNRDGEDEIASVSLCDGHRAALQPELDALYGSFVRLRENESESARIRASGEGPEIEVVWVPERPIDLVRRKP